MKGGIDDGPCFFYWRLSYRRKVIRALWAGVLGLLVLVCFQMLGLLRWELELVGVPHPEAVGWAVIALHCMTVTAQTVYTYCRWQHEVRGRPNHPREPGPRT